MASKKFKECTICSRHHILNKDDLNKKVIDKLSFLIEHVIEKINTKTFDDELNVTKIFNNIKLHCGLSQYAKKDIAKDYKRHIRDKTIESNLIFEKLIYEVSNGELCISVPSKALDSCPFSCAFCPTAKVNSEDSKNGKNINLKVAKSYTLDQPVFRNLVTNDNNLIKYLLQHMVKQHVNSYDVSKLAMRHLGGTFSTYSKAYRYEYSRDIFYAANVLPDIINNEELLELTKKSFGSLFDPDDYIINKLRKPFNYQKLIELQSFIDKYKMWGKTFQDKIKEYEELYFIELEKSLKEEQDYNSKNKSHEEQNYNIIKKPFVVSYSIETRPDTINITMIKELLKLGVTIVELGLQSPNNEILKINKRGHDVEASKGAIRMLKDNGLHVHGQWMLDLPGSTKEIDTQCVNDMLSDELRCDQIKIYPHLSMPGTETKEWLDTGKYQSWVDQDPNGFNKLMIDYITNLDETTRIVRVQRDLPKKSELTPEGYTNDQPSNLEELITKKIYKVGKTREDIRYHEPGLRFADLDNIKYYVDIKELVGGKDIFISAQSYICNDINRGISDFRIVWGYCRLRIINYNYENTKIINFFENKEKYGRIRELKVNGATSAVGAVGTSGQHKGIGTNMLKIAEEMAYKFGMTHVTVTSAVGVRDYYRLKHGYELDECGLMWKKLDKIKLRKLVKFNNSKTKYEILMDSYIEENNNNNNNNNNKIMKYIIPTSIITSVILISYTMNRYKFRFF
jgi:elongator complex protein 3